MFFNIAPSLNSRTLFFLRVTRIKNNANLALCSKVCSQYSSLPGAEKQFLVQQTLYPTHYVTCRDFSSGTVHRNTTPDNRKKRPRVQVGFTFGLKFFFISLLDRSVKSRLGVAFLDGLLIAFDFVSECLHSGHYEKLADVVTPTLSGKITRKTVYPKNASKDICLSKGVIAVIFRDLKWQVDRETKNKTLDATVCYVFSDKVFEQEPTLEAFVPFMRTGNIQDRPVKFAVYKYSMTYGKDIEDTPWIVTDIFYFTWNDNTFNMMFRNKK